MPEIVCQSISEDVARIKIFKDRFPEQRSHSLSAEVEGGKWSTRGDLSSFKVLKEGSKVAQFENVKFSVPEWLKSYKPGSQVEAEGSWTAVEHLVSDSKIFGLGEKTKGLEKSHSTWEMWNTDPGGSYRQDEDPLYCSFPFYLIISDNKLVGIHVDHPERSVFDVKNRTGSDRVGLAVNQSYLCFYLLYSHDLKKILNQYTNLLGRPFFPPRWALGYHQSRWGYPSTGEEVVELAKKFRQEDIPCDVLHLDIQYMDKNKVFTWSKELGEPEELCKKLHDLQFKVVAILDPGVKIEKGYAPYESGKQKDVFIRTKEGKYYKGGLWPGLCHFPDFFREDVREWWAKQHGELLSKGIDGIWNDMNEPSIFHPNWKKEVSKLHISELSLGFVREIFLRTPAGIKHKIDDKQLSHREVHNLYALEEAKATRRAFELFQPGRRPFILTRSAFSGIQQYAAIWTGDNCSSWNHLKLSIPMCLNLGLSGVPFVGVDIGGFHGDCEPELLARWTQLGAFLPFFRNHSGKGAKQEPWAFGEPFKSINREAIQLRYKLLPYLYTLFFKASHKGIPPMRPLFMEFPQDTDSYSVEDEFMVGSALLVSPVLDRGAKRKMTYLPSEKGESIQWEDWWTGELYESGYHLLDVKLDRIPLFIREGHGVPLIRAIQNTEELPDKLRLRCNLAGNVKIPIYWDDGESLDYKEGNYFLGNLWVKRKEDRVDVSCEVKRDGYEPFWKEVELDLRTEGVR